MEELTFTRAKLEAGCPGGTLPVGGAGATGFHPNSTLPPQKMEVHYGYNKRHLG